MPAVGERKIKDGVLGEWDGATWRQIAQPGTRKTQGGVTGEWNGSTWRQVSGGEMPSDATRGMRGQSTALPGERAPNAERALLPGIVAAAGKAAPGAVSMMNRAAKIAPAMVGRGPVGKYGAAGVPIAGALAAGDLIEGRPKEAAAKVVGATAVASAPTIAKAIERATAPAGGAARNAAGRFAGINAGGFLSRAAKAVSRWSGPASIASLATLPPHGPTADTLEGRKIQDRVARLYAKDVNQREGRQVFDLNADTDTLLAAIKTHRNRSALRGQ